MSANSSFNSSFNPDCIEKVVFMSSAICAVYLLLLPLFLLVLYMGCQRRGKVAASHLDVFTFHMSAMELIGILGTFLFLSASFIDRPLIETVGEALFSMISPGEILFHILTCGERYLAVVHPVAYLGLRQAGGVRIRNICIGCVWLISLGSVGLVNLGDIYTISFYIFVVLSLIFVPFLSISVLCALTRPGPGEVAGNGDRIDQSRQRAFYTVVAIMGALSMRFFCSLIAQVVYFPPAITYCDRLFIGWSVTLFYLPSSLVLPLLFLHRAGKLPGCKHNTGSIN